MSANRVAHTAATPEAAPWTFLTNHAHVLICLAADPEARIRDVADRVGITERAVQRIVGDLEEAGYLTRQKEGRRNHYEVTADLPLRHPVEQHCRTAALLAMVLGNGSAVNDPAARQGRGPGRPRPGRKAP